MLGSTIVLTHHPQNQHVCSTKDAFMKKSNGQWMHLEVWWLVQPTEVRKLSNKKEVLLLFTVDLLLFVSLDWGRSSFSTQRYTYSHTSASLCPFWWPHRACSSLAVTFQTRFAARGSIPPCFCSNQWYPSSFAT